MPNITCPHCGFSKDVPKGAIPARTQTVTCPSCQSRFPLREPSGPPPESPSEARQDRPASHEGLKAESPSRKQLITCPVCATEPAEALRCERCGLIFEKWHELREEGEDFYLADSGEMLCGADTVGLEPPFEAMHKAGFWLRSTAALVDLTCLVVAKVIFGLLLGGVVMLISWGWQLGPDGTDTLMVPLKLFNIALFLAYFIVFTGYGGQTPGKMLLRLQVIRQDDGPIGYGRAFVREGPGKLLSVLLLGMGFAMIAFQKDKRALHDLLADSCVIKLR